VEGEEGEEEEGIFSVCLQLCLPKQGNLHLAMESKMHQPS